MAIQAIWKDRYVDLGSDASISYRIKVGDNVIYLGKAYKRPGADSIVIRINDVCADYIENVLPTLSAAQFTALGDVAFVTEAEESSSWVEKDSVTFINDWSYDYDHNVETDGLSVPIRTDVDARQLLLFSVFNSSEVTATFHYLDGTSSVQIIPIEITDDYDSSFNIDFSHSLRGAMSGTAVIDLSTHPDVVSVDINGETFNVIGSCSKFAFYYINAYGGWNSLLVNGNSSESDNLTRHIKEHYYDNTNAMNRGSDNYLNEIVKNYTINTGWMSNEESMKMHHLLNSTKVYLYDFAKAQMIPVNITNTLTEYKTIKGNQGQANNYTIECSVAQTRIRR